MTISFPLTNQMFNSMEYNLGNSVKNAFSKELQDIDEKFFFPKLALLDMLDGYSDEELHQLFNHFVEIKKEVFANVSQLRHYLVSTGTGTRKFPILVEELKQRGVRFAYISVERIFSKILKKAEDKERQHWAQGVEFIATALFGLALSQGVAIAHEALPFGIDIDLGFSNIRNQFHYVIELFHVTSNEVDKNDQLFFKNLGCYLRSSHEISFYYQQEQNRILAGKRLISGTLLEVHRDALEKIKKLHNAEFGQNYWNHALISNFPINNVHNTVSQNYV